MCDEEWVKVATVDDTVVAELLLRLKQVKQQPPPPPVPGQTSKPGLSLEWSVRQRRSKAVIVQAKNQAPRASPTTPLSWSGATSVSGGGASGSGGSFDGGPEEESGRPSPLTSPPKCSETSRSKAIGCESTNAKKSRKKKTLAELKEEEDLLERERRELKKELATLRLNLEKERARNENMKRMKLDLHALPAVESGRQVTSELAISNQLVQKMASLDHVPAILPPNFASNGGSLQSHPANICTEGNKEVTVGKFVLPDLNIPFEDNTSCDALCGVS